METTTTEFSFVLRPGAHGVGVFATHAIAKGAPLRLFGDHADAGEEVRILKRSDIPESFIQHCIIEGNELHCPMDFGKMQIGWYLNHSKEPNAIHTDFLYFAARDIAADEEILIDYNSLEEPEDEKAAYYR